MGVWAGHIVPRVVERALSGPEIEALRARTVEGLSGVVLEVGFGSGRNLKHLPSTITKLLAVEPNNVARRSAQARIGASAVPVEIVGLDGQHLPLGDASVDAAFCTWTLCTIPDVALALRELHRVIRPGGQLRFVEHGLHPAERTARLQRRWNPIQKVLFDGCHVNRDHERLVNDAGFSVEALDHPPLSGPDFLTYCYLGSARR